RINGTSFVFSAAIPALLAVSASEGINILTSTPSLLQTLHENVIVIRSILEKVPDIEVTSHPASAVIHVALRQGTTASGFLLPNAVPTQKVNPSAKSNPTLLPPKDYVEHDWKVEDRIMQEIVDEALAQGVLITRAQRLRGQESLEPKASIKVVATSALTKKECEKAASTIKSAIVKVLNRRR
ncbi:serine palmitoyltransferase component, partial [Tulasnella sp. 403]